MKSFKTSEDTLPVPSTYSSIGGEQGINRCQILIERVKRGRGKDYGRISPPTACPNRSSHSVFFERVTQRSVT
eukprot:709871-Amorphochlora_amoeboformis.AAC.1